MPDFTLNVLSQNTFTEEEKVRCLPRVDYLLTLHTTVAMSLLPDQPGYGESERNKAAIELEAKAQECTCNFIKTGLFNILYGVIPEAQSQILKQAILSDKNTGAALLEQLITMEGLLAMARMENPVLMKIRLMSMLGTKYMV